MSLAGRRGREIITNVCENGNERMSHLETILNAISLLQKCLRVLKTLTFLRKGERITLPRGTGLDAKSLLIPMRE